MSSLLIAYQLKGKNVIVIGAGEVASGRVKACVDAGAGMIEIYGSSIHPDIEALLEEDTRGVIQIFEMDAQPENIDLDGFQVAFTAIDDRRLSEEFVQYFRGSNIMCNAADIPELCDFYFGSTITRGPLQILVSTNGQAPRLAKRVREEIENKVDDMGMEGAFEKVGRLRAKLRQRTVHGETGYDPETIRKRMKWMSDISDNWTFSQMASLNDYDMSKLVSMYPHSVSYQDIKGE